jgi:hypothetical protein
MVDRELAVMTGDIVASSRLAPGDLDGVLETVAASAETAASWSGGQARFGRHRGDGWQCLGPSPALSLRAALFIRAGLRARRRDLDTRISVGVGTGAVPEAGVSGASGPAFERSGAGLDGLGRGARFVFAPVADRGLEQAVFALADEISRRWTARQAEVFVHALPPDAPTQSVIARRIGVSQQMVAKHLRAGGDWALREAMAALEARL